MILDSGPIIKDYVSSSQDTVDWAKRAADVALTVGSSARTIAVSG